MSLPFISARGNRGGSFAAGPAAPAADESGPYALGTVGATDYETTVTPVAHWDAGKMNGTDNTGRSDDQDITSSNPWVSRVGDYSCYQTWASYPARYNSSQINSLPAVTPNLALASASDQWFRMGIYNAAADAASAINLTKANGYHVFFAGHTIYLSGSYRYFRDETATTEIFRSGTTTLYGWNYVSGPTATFTIANTTGSDHWWDFRVFDDGGTDKTGFKLHEDGSAAVVETATTSVIDLSAALIGTGLGTSLHEKIGEMIFFNEELSTEDREAVEDYLDDKYAITDS